ncbi:uncharacterized protein MONBRDRAFT_38069 [Monosiga brevicollis MX1]|uniref:SH2 domain-containing protein n=1 Tax=Monosiga brevicollis TaxID=81824 RepID=A9V5H9_MONBE|nr:uncharacterized protein MONBRDRAFT_38069 [Monosiga brevicollis MX1]EDQ87373.1 predicted protein [Monosiga brevicollis MX1]|eukprot:XP_001747986.1 hypothetical protein [Monosiga brevicollis MX1]
MARNQRAGFQWVQNVNESESESEDETGPPPVPPIHNRPPLQLPSDDFVLKNNGVPIDLQRRPLPPQPGGYQSDGGFQSQPSFSASSQSSEAYNSLDRRPLPPPASGVVRAPPAMPVRDDDLRGSGALIGSPSSGPDIPRRARPLPTPMDSPQPTPLSARPPPAIPAPRAAPAVPDYEDDLVLPDLPVEYHQPMPRPAVPVMSSRPAPMPAPAPTPSVNPNNPPWFHMTVDRQKAESMLRKAGLQDGMFLIRPASKPRCYALTMCRHGRILHNTIEAVGHRYRYVGPDRTFDSLADLVEHYMYGTRSEELRLLACVPNI